MTAASVAANLEGVALFALPGLGLTELFKALRRLPLPRRLAYAWLLGVFAVAGALFAASHLLGVPLRRPAILCAAAWPILLGVGARLRHQRRPAVQNRIDRWHLLAALLIGAVCLGPLTSALAAPLADWDGRMTWSPLASSLRHEGKVDAAVLREPVWWVLHPRYPPLLPLAQAAVQELTGAGVDDQHYRAFYVAFLVTLLLLVHDGASRVAGRNAALLATACVATLPFLSYGAGGATSAYSDLPLACFYGGALVLLLLERPTPSTGLAAGCLLASAVFTKSEGALLAAAALLLGSLRLLGRGRGPRRPAWLAAAAVPPLAAFALLTAWRAAIPNREDEDYFGVLRLSDLLRGAFTRLPEIVPELLRWTFRWSDWLAFWLLFPLALLAGHRALRHPRARLLLLAGLVPPLIGWAAYAVSTRLGNLIGETWGRFLLQGLVPLAIVLACAFRDLLRRAWPSASSSGSSSGS